MIDGQLTELVDIGIAVCECGDFATDHEYGPAACTVCGCRLFRQDVESDSYYIATAKHLSLPLTGQSWQTTSSES